MTAGNSTSDSTPPRLSAILKRRKRALYLERDDADAAEAVHLRSRDVMARVIVQLGD